MTRSRHRSRQFGNQNTKSTTRVANPPSVWTLKEKISVCGGLIAGVMVLLGFPIANVVMTHRNQINGTLKSWQDEFHLTDEEVSKMRELEFGFHGSGNPLSKSADVASEELSRHYIKLAGVLNPESAAKFLFRLQKEGEPRP